MSLYNAVMGTNPLADVLLGMLELERAAVPRFRDVFLNEDGTEIIIYTRTGGGNRRHYESAKSYRNEEGEEGHGPFNSDLRAVSGFKFDRDDDFDCTYATFHFDVPKEFQEYIAALLKLSQDHKGGSDTFRDVIEKLKSGDTGDPRVQNALDVGKKLLALLVSK